MSDLLPFLGTCYRGSRAMCIPHPGSKSPQCLLLGPSGSSRTGAGIEPRAAPTLHLLRCLRSVSSEESQSWTAMCQKRRLSCSCTFKGHLIVSFSGLGFHLMFDGDTPHDNVSRWNVSILKVCRMGCWYEPPMRHSEFVVAASPLHFRLIALDAISTQG